jgi:hypothetical protein
MLGGPRIQTYLTTIYERRHLARDVLLGVLLLFGMFALWARQYSASAIVQLTSSSTEQARASAVDGARSTLNDERLAAIMEQIQLYPEMVRTRGQASAIRYMRSGISLQAAGRGKNNTGEVRVSYLSPVRATVIKVANALAQSLAEVKPSAAGLLSVDIAAKIERQLEDSRSELKQLAARQHKRAKVEGLRTSLRRTSLLEDKKRRSLLEQQRGQASDQGRVGSSAAPVSVPLPETSAAKAIQQQIKDAEARLIELRQRYTDQYPDVQDAQEQLQELRSKLNRLQVESPRSTKETLPNRDDGRIPREEEQIRADQGRAQKEIRRDAATTVTKREKSSRPSTVARVYALELDRYHALLRAQRTMQEYQAEGLGSPQLLFTVVQKATRAEAAGIAVNPLYWLTGLLAGLFAATLSVLLAHHLKTPPREQIAIRSQFEREELAPQYRHGTR